VTSVVVIESCLIGAKISDFSLRVSFPFLLCLCDVLLSDLVLIVSSVGLQFVG
jgi:hypothetical protein